MRNINITNILITIYNNIQIHSDCYMNSIQKKEEIKENIQENINTLIKYIENEVSSEDYKKEYIDTMLIIKKHIIDNLPFLNIYNTNINIINSYKNIIEIIIGIIEKIDTPLRKLKISKDIAETIKKKCSSILENQNKIELHSHIYNYFYNYFPNTYISFPENTQNREELKVKIKELLNKDIDVFLDLIIQALSQNQQEILHEIKISPLLNEIKDLLYKLNSYVSNEEETKLIEGHN